MTARNKKQMNKKDMQAKMEKALNRTEKQQQRVLTFEERKSTKDRLKHLWD